MRYLYALLLAAGCSLNAPGVQAETLRDIVELKTNIGTITIKLDYQNAPLTAKNFLSYVDKNFYKDMLIHRVIKDFVVQGGGFSKVDGKLKKTLAPIINEGNNGLKNLTGTIAMARTNDPNSATSQFFINLNNNNFLDYNFDGKGTPGYAVFGEVIDGMDIVRKIENLATYNEFPFTNLSSVVFIENVYSSTEFDSNVSTTRITLSGSGKVVSDPAAINCGNICSESKPAAGSVQLMATAAAGYLFSGWRGDCQGFNRVITLDRQKGNHNCTAVFIKNSSAAQ